MAEKVLGAGGTARDVSRNSAGTAKFQQQGVSTTTTSNPQTTTVKTVLTGQAVHSKVKLTATGLNGSVKVKRGGATLTTQSTLPLTWTGTPEAKSTTVTGYMNVTSIPGGVANTSTATDTPNKVFSGSETTSAPSSPFIAFDAKMHSASTGSNASRVKAGGTTVNGGLHWTSNSQTVTNAFLGINNAGTNLLVTDNGSDFTLTSLRKWYGGSPANTFTTVTNSGQQTIKTTISSAQTVIAGGNVNAASPGLKLKKDGATLATFNGGTNRNFQDGQAAFTEITSGTETALTSAGSLTLTGSSIGGREGGNNGTAIFIAARAAAAATGTFTMTASKNATVTVT